MKYVLMIVFGVIGWFVGILGWAQIVGSIQQFRNRGPAASMYTIILWAILLGGATAIVFFLLRKYLVAYLIGLGIGLVQILFAGEIK